MEVKNLFLAVLILMLALGLAFTSCASGGAGNDSSNYRAVVELTGNPTTGYTWVCSLTPEGIVKEISNEYIPDPTEPGVTGSGGKFVFTFQAIKEGEAELLFSYLRPWEENVPALRTETYHANVDGSGSLTITRK